MKRTIGLVYGSFLFLTVAAAQQSEAPPRSPAWLSAGSETTATRAAPRSDRARFDERIITTFAGTDWIFPSDSGPALNAPLAQVDQLGVDLDGNILIADPG